MRFPFFWSMKRFHIPEKQKPQLNRCENLHTCKLKWVCTRIQARTQKNVQTKQFKTGQMFSYFSLLLPDFLESLSFQGSCRIGNVCACHVKYYAHLCTEDIINMKFKILMAKLVNRTEFWLLAFFSFSLFFEKLLTFYIFSHLYGSRQKL